jgi:hypothetical protein
MMRPRTHAMGRMLAAVLALTAIIAAQGAYDKLLTVADVEKVADWRSTPSIRASASTSSRC